MQFFLIAGSRIKASHCQSFLKNVLPLKCFKKLLYLKWYISKKLKMALYINFDFAVWPFCSGVENCKVLPEKFHNFTFYLRACRALVITEQCLVVL